MRLARSLLAFFAEDCWKEKALPGANIKGGRRWSVVQFEFHTDPKEILPAGLQHH